MLVSLMATVEESAAVPPRAAASICPSPHPHSLFADVQAQVYAVREGPLKYLSIRACAYGQRRSFIVAACDNEESATTCADNSHVTLAGAMVASEDIFQVEGHEVEKSIDEWHVEVRNLHTGRILHEVPTGTPLKPEPRYVGVGPIVGLVLKSDGVVAWIAEDYERSSVPGRMPFTIPYFDLYAVNKSSSRLLASGTDIDASSLALSVGSISVGNRRTIAGSTLYWTQGGKPALASLG